MFNTDFNLGLLAGHNIWQSVIIFAVVFIILKVIRETSAEEKSWSWSATLFALAILPMAAFLPGEGFKWKQEQALSQFSVSQIEYIAPINIESPSLAKDKVKSVYAERIEMPVISPEKTLSAFILLWFLGMVVAFFRLAVAGYNAAKLRNNAYPYAPETNILSADVEIAISDEINGPIVVGIFRPIILLPRKFAYEMETKELEPLLFHELAHIKRYDNILHLFERIVLSVYWWNPIMHFIAGRISEERELACDDRAAQSCGDHIIYARSLLKGARKLVGEKNAILGLAVLRRESPLSKRVKRLTDSTSQGGLNMMRFAKNLSVLFMSILMLGLITPRFAIGQVDVDGSGQLTVADAEKSVDRLYSDGGVDAVLLEIELLSNDYDVRLYTESLVEVYELDNAQITRLIGTVDKMESDHDKNVALAAIANEQELEGDTAEMIARAATGDEDIDLDEETIAIVLADIDTEAGNGNLEVEIQQTIIESMPTEEEIEFIMEEAMAEMPTEEEIALIIEEAHADIPTEEELEQMIEESMPTEEELEQMIEESMPTEEEIEQMIEESMPTEEELERIVEEAKAAMPDKEELARMLEEAKANMPDKEEMARILEEAKANMPDKEEIARMVKEAKAGMPDKEEMARILEEAKANMPTKEELEKMKQEMQENLQEFKIRREEMQENLQEFHAQREEMQENLQEFQAQREFYTQDEKMKEKEKEDKEKNKE